MIEAVFFFDTYAIIELLKGNPNYKPYSRAVRVVSKLNLFELYYSTSQSYGKKKARELIERWSGYAGDFGIDVIAEAAELRLRYRKRDLSMTDCIGYIISKRLRLKFLTGDRQFQDMDDVEFVKA